MSRKFQEHSYCGVPFSGFCEPSRLKLHVLWVGGGLLEVAIAMAWVQYREKRYQYSIRANERYGRKTQLLVGMRMGHQLLGRVGGMRLDLF